MRFWASFLLMFLVCSECFAHKDRIFSVSSTNGKVEGIPEKFGEVFILVDWNKKPNGSVKITIGSHVLDLPTCVSKLFMGSNHDKMRITGSWYHDRSVLPPYLSIELPDKSASKPNSNLVSGHKILMNLETAEIIEVEKLVVEANPQSVRSEEIDLKKVCPESERKKLIPSVRK